MEKRTIFGVGAVVVLVGAVFARVTGFVFLEWDDRANFAENPHVATDSLEGIAALWSGPFGQLYVPVTYSVWAVLARLSGWLGAGEVPLEIGTPGVAPALFHGANVVLHAGSAVLVFGILRIVQGSGFKVQGSRFRVQGSEAKIDDRLFRAALIGAGVFAVHPVQVEAVAWATGLKDVLSGFLGLAAMGVYLGGARVEGRGSRGEGGRGFSRRSLPDALCALLLFVLALLAKPGAVAVPVMLLALETVALGVPWKRSAARLWPWFAAAAAVVLVTRGVQGESVALAMPDGVPLWFRPFVFLDALGFYTGKVIAPMGLAVDYGRSPQWLLESGQWRVTWVVAAAVSVAAVMGSAGRRAKGGGREAGTAAGVKEEWPQEGGKSAKSKIEDHGLLAGAWFVFVAGVLPVSGLVAFAFQRNSTVADRYLYLPMLGVGIAVAIGYSMLDVRFWKDAGSGEGTAKDAKKAKEGKGGADTGDRKSTIEDPTSNIAHRTSIIVPVAGILLVVLLGVLSTFQLTYWRDSRALVVRALEVNPESPEMNYARGSQFLETGDVEMAVAFYRKALEGDARHWRAHHQLADALGEKGDWRRALSHLEEANAIMPDHPVVLGDLGFALAATGKRAEAEAQYRAVLELVPDDLRARHDLGVLLLERGAFGEAVAELEWVWERAPDETTAFNLKKARERYARELEAEGKVEEAREVRERAVDG